MGDKRQNGPVSERKTLQGELVDRNPPTLTKPRKSKKGDQSNGRVRSRRVSFRRTPNRSSAETPPKSSLGGCSSVTSVEYFGRVGDAPLKGIAKCHGHTIRPPKKLRLLIELLVAYQAPALLKGTAGKNPARDEIGIPIKKAAWGRNACSLTGTMEPAEEIANYIPTEIAKAKLKHRIPPACHTGRQRTATAAFLLGPYQSVRELGQTEAAQ